MLLRTDLKVTCNSAGAGLATGTAISRQPVNGMILGVYLDAASGAPASVDLDVREAKPVSPKVILVKSNVNTDQWFQPRDPIHLASNGSAITGGSSPIFVNDSIIVTIAQANNGQVFDVSIQWDDNK